jgi:predicted nuclease with TOPRIM domain
MNIEEVKKEIKLINRRTEETLNIIVDHFKEVDERLEELEDKLEKLENGN